MIFTGGNSAINSHSMMREQLQSHLNSKYSLVQLMHILHETYQPLSSIAKLAIIPHLGIPVSYSEFIYNSYLQLFICSVHKYLCFRFAFYRNRQPYCASFTKRCTV